MSITRAEALEFLCNRPYQLGHMLGFTLLTEMHNQWIVKMLRGKDDWTLQAHRGSYKTTCVSIALALIIILLPNKKTLFMRKTDTDVKEIVQQVKKILESPQVRYFVSVIYNTDLKLTVSNQGELSTNLTTDPRGTAQLVAQGCTGSLTGKHFDFIFTDDIVNIQDRVSKAERDHTKMIYQELQNIVNRNGRIVNTGTPWHKEDAFMLMPPADKYDCYTTGLISQEKLQDIKNKMVPSLFAANYELRHIASDDVIFASPIVDMDPALVEQGIMHIDAAYGGEDYTAATIIKKRPDGYYVIGHLWKKHVDDCIDKIIAMRSQYMLDKIICEDNGDKGYLAKDLRKRGERVNVYHESMNKIIKIESYLKTAWNGVHFCIGTDKEYLEQICDWTEDAEHDDAPDSLASAVRYLWKKNTDDDQYISVF